jgi:hypothetical protein
MRPNDKRKQAFERMMAALKAYIAGRKIIMQDPKVSLLVHVYHKDLVAAQAANGGKGGCSNGAECVVGQAIMRAGGGEFVSVGSSVVKVFRTVGTRVLCERWIVPSSIRAAVKNYDTTGEWLLEEGSYTFSAPVGLQRLGAVHPATGKRSARKTGSKKPILTRYAARLTRPRTRKAA